MLSGRFLSNSGQVWKLLAFCAWVVASAAVTAASVKLGEPVLALGAGVSLACAAVWAGRSIRCPNCGERILWRMWEAGHLASWFTEVLTLETCPHCESPGRSRGRW